MNKTIYLFRHAMAVGTDMDYGDKIVTAQILPEGIPPISRMAQFLTSVIKSANYTSPFVRCLQTAQIITKQTGKKFIEDARLGEYLPAQEAYESVGKRVQSFLNSVNKITPENILICTHGIVIAAIKQLIFDGNFLEKDRLDYPKTGQLWILNGRRQESKDFN